jgi:hypothetical protein
LGDDVVPLGVQLLDGPIGTSNGVELKLGFENVVEVVEGRLPVGTNKVTVGMEGREGTGD